MDEAWLREQARAFGRRLLHARNGKGLTQAELAKRTGEPYMTIQAISKLENGKGDPLQSTVLRLARALDVPLHGLYGSEEEPAPRPLLSRTLAEVLRMFARLPESLQRQALHLLTELERLGIGRDADALTDAGPDRSKSPSPPG